MTCIKEELKCGVGYLACVLPSLLPVLRDSRGTNSSEKNEKDKEVWHNNNKKVSVTGNLFEGRNKGEETAPVGEKRQRSRPLARILRLKALGLMTRAE